MGDIRITGDVTGNVQTGSHAQARFVHNETAPAAPAEPPEVRHLLAAVEALRDRLGAAAPVELHADDVRIAEEALDEVAAAGTDGEPEPGRVRRAMATVTGALASAAGLAQAVAAVRDAARPWF
jgi:hypothetical protein